MSAVGTGVVGIGVQRSSSWTWFVASVWLVTGLGAVLALTQVVSRTTGLSEGTRSGLSLLSMLALLAFSAGCLGAMLLGLGAVVRRDPVGVVWLGLLWVVLVALAVLPWASGTTVPGDAPLTVLDPGGDPVPDRPGAVLLPVVLILLLVALQVVTWVGVRARCAVQPAAATAARVPSEA